MAPSPSGGGSSGGNAYIPYNQSGLDTSFNNNYNQYGTTLGNYYGQTNPAAYNTFLQNYNNPYTQNAMGGATAAQNSYYGAANMAQPAGNQMYGLSGNLANAATSWDPNGTMKAYMAQQAGDTANAQSYLRGIQGSPYGASVATNAIDQSNLAYQQTALQNQLAATQGAGAAAQQGAGLQGLAAQYQQTGSTLPYNTANSIYGNQNQAISGYYGTMSPYLQGLNQLQSNALGYMNNAQGAQNQAFNQGAQTASGISQALTPALQGIGGAIGGYFGGGGSSSYGNPFSTGTSMYSSPTTYDYYGANSLGSSFGGLGY